MIFVCADVKGLCDRRYRRSLLRLISYAISGAITKVAPILYKSVPFSSLSCSTVFFLSENLVQTIWISYLNILVHTTLAANIEVVTSDIVSISFPISFPMSYPISCHFYVTKIRFKRNLESYFAIQNNSSLFMWATIVWWQNRPSPNLSHHGIQMWVIMWLSQPTNAHLTTRQKCW